MKVLANLEVEEVILLGVGAGGNIACRMAMMVPRLVLGIIAIQTTAAAAGIMETVKVGIDSKLGKRISSVNS